MLHLNSITFDIVEILSNIETENQTMHLTALTICDRKPTRFAGIDVIPEAFRIFLRTTAL